MSTQEYKNVEGLLTYPEEYIVIEDEAEMGESAPHAKLIDYLLQVLQWLYYVDNWEIARERDLHHSAIRNSKQLIVPDIVIFKGITLTPTEQNYMKSYTIKPPQRPAPPVVFEIASAATWNNDIQAAEHQKPQIYGRIGVKEYFAYDPHSPQVWRNSGGQRLKGWRFAENGTPVELVADQQGRLESLELDSWLVPDGLFLRLYDRQGNLRLTKAEHEVAARQAVEQQLAELQRRLAELEKQ